MKKIRMFVATYIRDGRVFCLFVAGIFCALALHIYGFDTPVSVLNGPTAVSWCKSAGKVGTAFLYPADKHFTGMTTPREKCLNRENMPWTNRSAHDTSESLYSKFLIEKQAKNQAYGYIFSRGLFRDYLVYSRGMSCDLSTLGSRLEIISNLKNNSMPHVNPKSRRQQLINLKIGKSLSFPLSAGPTIKSQLSELKFSTGQRYKVESKPEAFVVTRIS